MEKIKKAISDRGKVIGDWVKGNRREAAILALILLVGAFLRLYRIDEYMTFLGDEGRDAIVVRRLIVDFDPILVGPRTSIGDMYLGPLYYYMMAPVLALSFLSPVGPAIMIAVLGVATIFLVWWIGREWFPSARASTESFDPELKTEGLSRTSSGQASIAGLFAAGLYAISPVVIVHSRHSWNPNIMPFFALLTIYGFWRVFVQRTTGLWPGKKRFRWLIVVGVSFAFTLQSHYLALLLGPVIAIFWLLTFIRLRQATSNKRQAETKSFLRFTVYGLLIFVLLMSPLVIFDARHSWRNFASIKQFFIVRQTTVSARPWTAIPKLPLVVPQVLSRLLAGKNETVGTWLSLAIVVGAVWALYQNVVKKRTERLSAYFLVLVWIVIAFIGLGVYKQHIYDHYYGFFFTAPFLLLGGIAGDLIKSGKQFGKLVVLAAFLLLVYVNLAENPLKYSPNRQLQRTEEVADKIRTEAKGDDFNLAVIAERNYEDAYQYFLEKEREPVIDIDPLRADETITEQLFVVCEVAKEDCNPVNNPKAEVANFGWSKIDSQWEVSGVILYKLIHTK